jgi:hypothetical protein
MTLNEMKAGIEKVIAPTDSRFRTDIKQLELGDLGKSVDLVDSLNASL